MKLTIYGIIIALSIILFMFFEIKIAKSERDLAISQVKILNQKINDQNDAIKKIHDESVLKQKQINDALKESEKIRDKYNVEANKILLDTVSSDCEQAIKWGAEKGATIYQCWISHC